MNRDSSSKFIRERLLGETDFEVAGSDRATGVGYRLTVRHGEIDVAPFSRIESKILQASVKAERAVSIGSTQYRVEKTFGPTFLRAVRQAARVAAMSVTVQTNQRIVSFIGRDPSRLSDVVESHLPPTLEWARDTFVEGSREWGRKIGHAAKDLAGLREAAFSLEYLETLERSGESEAYEAVHKEAVWPAPTLEFLRDKGVPPTIAFGIVSVWRMLKKRPARNPAFRLAYVRDLPTFVADVEGCRTLDSFAAVVASHVANYANNAKAIVGTRLPSFAERIDVEHSRRSYYSHRDLVLRELLVIDALDDEESQWSYAAESLSTRRGTSQPAGLPMPTRPAILLHELKRSGPKLPKPPVRERISVELGITGLELGNYVSEREGEQLAHLLAEAITDLRHILGDWIVPLCRSGNLSVALGARGKGKGCAHYEPALRVINLTKLRGDGSLAHEFGHFVDHLLAHHVREGESRFLSARVQKCRKIRHPIAAAMQRVMQAISVTPCRERVTGVVNPKRWYLKGWIKKRGYDPDLPPQVSFDRVADREPNYFRRGRNPRDNSIELVHSLAKFGQSPVEIEIAYDANTNFAQEAKKLGKYWHCREELFARSFEAFVEDSITRRNWRSDYLVFGTQLNYSDVRGLPYPIGPERQRIAEALTSFVAACACEP